jgi:hypothetical protein
MIPFTLAVFEPGSSALQADAMTSAPCRQGHGPVSLGLHINPGKYVCVFVTSLVVQVSAT